MRSYARRTIEGATSCWFGYRRIPTEVARNCDKLPQGNPLPSVRQSGAAFISEGGGVADYSSLIVKHVMIHQVPRKGSDEEPKYSEIPTPMTSRIPAYIKKRITSTAASTLACDAVIDREPEKQSPIPGLVESYLATRTVDQLVSMSQQIAAHLFDIQNQRNPEGLVWVVDGEIDALPALIILKLEREEGVGITDTTIDGKKTVRVDLSELVLAARTRVYKAGIFTLSGSDILVRVSDDQMGGGEIARFFLERFLGCKRTEEPAYTTLRFLDVTEGFINREIKDPIQRSKYHLGLISELQSHHRQVKPGAFIHSVIDREHRQPLHSVLEAESLMNVFEKDTQFIKSRIKGLQLSFASGTTVFAPPSAIDDTVTIQTKRGDVTKVTIEDEVTSMNGRRSRRGVKNVDKGRGRGVGGKKAPVRGPSGKSKKPD